jgi:hypothetical protein
MDNTLGYILTLPFEIKLIIYAKLPGNLMVSGVNDRHAETIFKYRYPWTYHKFKNIIKVNRRLNFDDYITEGPHFWKVLLKSELSYDRQKLLNQYHELYFDHTWKTLTAYMNIISVNMHCLSLFYDKFPEVYGYINRFMSEDMEICLLYDSITVINYKELHDMFKYGNIQSIHLTSDDLYDLGVNSFIFISFLLMIVPKDFITFENFDVLREIRRDSTGGDTENHFDLIKLYYGYEAIYDKYYDNIRAILNF